MKPIITILAISAIALLQGCFTSQKAPPPRKAAPQVDVSLQVFYDDLSPYGQWGNHPDFGYVWMPRVHQGFSPYGSDGHWIFTNDGWTWVSDYSWGWAPFHYGRWHRDNNHGWLWIPDTEWGPAWVGWRKSDGYYGWAPMGPRTNVNKATGRDFDAPPDHWVFVKDKDFDRPDVNKYYINKTNNITIINKSNVITNTHVDNKRNVTYITGPDKDEVQKHTGKPVKPYAVKEVNKPGQKINKNELQIYKPQVNKMNKDGKEPAPAKTIAIKKGNPQNDKNDNKDKNDKNDKKQDN